MSGFLLCVSGSAARSGLEPGSSRRHAWKKSRIIMRQRLQSCRVHEKWNLVCSFVHLSLSAHPSDTTTAVAACTVCKPSPGESSPHTRKGDEPHQTKHRLRTKTTRWNGQAVKGQQTSANTTRQTAFPNLSLSFARFGTHIDG